MASEQQHYSDTPSERWRAIPGFEGYYEASDQGRVRSLDRIVERTNHSAMKLKGKVLSQQFRRNTGYVVVALSKNGKPKDWYVHRLVLMTFVGLPEVGHEACHQNDVRTDNRLTNLRWDTHTGNVHDALKRNRMINHNRERMHCKRGHRFAAPSTPGGRRICYPCRRLTERIRYHKKQKAV